jgi:pyroglutamyl-peptidase
MRPIVVVLAAAVATGCAAADDGLDAPRPNDGMFRDFLDGKVDGAGHPLNARVIPVEQLCPGALERGEACVGALDGTAQRGELVVSARVRVRAGGARIRVLDGDMVSAETLLGPDRVRELDAWFDVPVAYGSDGAPRTVEITGDLELDYVEVFPQRFRIVLGPGSGILDDDDEISVEVPIGIEPEHVELEEIDVTEAFLAAATRTDTAFRTLYTIRAGELGARGDVAQLRVHADGEAARMELRRAAAPCAYEGDPDGVPVLVTGFQPFPADGWHDNVSEVAVRALRPAAVPGARVLRLILPVEYDRAAAAVRDAIARCAPAVVVSFGQGGGAIALEQTAYNLKDTGEVAGGVPDNRGVIAAALPIDPTAPAERASTLPLDAIDRALRDLDEAPVRSDDPGRYICNNVFFAAAGASPRAGFVHLPYTTRFDDTRRWGAIAEAVVNAVK